MSCTKRVFPPRSTQNCFLKTWLLSVVPWTCQQLVCLLHLMYRVMSDVCYHECPATSRAEPVPSTGAAAALKHPKLPLLAATSIRCGSFGFVFFFFCADPAVRSGQDNVGGAPGRAQMGIGDRGKAACGVPGSTFLGDWEQLCLDFIKGAAHTWQSSCCLPGWGPRASQPAVNLSDQHIASTPWYKPRNFCSAAHSYCKAEGVIWNHNIHLTSERGCYTQNHNSFGQAHIFVSWINLCSCVVPFRSDCQQNSGERLDIIASKGFLNILLKKKNGKKP